MRRAPQLVEMCRCVEPRVGSRNGAACCALCLRPLRDWHGKGGRYIPTPIYNEECKVKTSDLLTDAQLRAGIDVLCVHHLFSRSEVVKRVVDAVYPPGAAGNAMWERIQHLERERDELRACVRALLACRIVHQLGCLIYDDSKRACTCALQSTLDRARAISGAPAVVNACPACAARAIEVEHMQDPLSRAVWTRDFDTPPADPGITRGLVSTYYVHCTHAQCALQGPRKSSREEAVRAWNNINIDKAA